MMMPLAGVSAGQYLLASLRPMLRMQTRRIRLLYCGLRRGLIEMVRIDFLLGIHLS